jgi:hypothetical protein
MSRRCSFLFAMLALAVACVPQAAASPIIAYDVPGQTVGNQVWTGSLGMDFNVVDPIVVEALGAFDSGQDGISGTVTVAIYDRQTQLPVTPLVSFTSNNGTLIGGSRFQDITPVTLAPGQYSIVAWGYNDLEPDGNLGCNSINGGSCLGNSIAGSTLNDGGGLIQFTGLSHYSDGTGYPGTPDSGPDNRYLAGTFEFENAIPEPLTLGLCGAALLAFGLLRRRFSA